MDSASRGDDARSRALTAIDTLAGWIWAAPVILSTGGLLIALLTEDHRLASRSAAVLLLCVLIWSVQHVLNDRPR